VNRRTVPDGIRDWELASEVRGWDLREAGLGVPQVFPLQFPDGWVSKHLPVLARRTATTDDPCVAAGGPASGRAQNIGTRVKDSRSQAHFPETASCGQVAKARELRLKQQFDRPHRAIAVLGHDHFGDAAVGRIWVVILIAVDHQHQIGILFNRARFP